MSGAKGVGIVGMDIYFPNQYVSQKDLEAYDGVSEGKYTIGLGQENMAVCGPAEDINSACLTAAANLLEKYNINPNDVGRLEVGTETMVDKSKAVKTTLMRLFGDNYDIEGVDSKNACYGGTSALLNSLAWVESSAWDGRYAMVVCGDIAVYEKGNARPTGGAGVLAMLIGPDAPMVIEPGIRATHMEDVYDFYKPTMTSEYPRVDGHLSNACYLRALDGCYNRYASKFEAKTGNKFTLADADYCVFHAPYNKLVQKSFGRYLYNDWKRNPDAHPQYADFAQYSELSEEDTYTDRTFLKHLVTASKEVYAEKVKPSELITKQCGNSYCGSTYAGLLSLITNKAPDLTGKRALLFSYGSGLAATSFSVKFEKSVEEIAKTADVQARLDARVQVSAEEYSAILDEREKTHALYDFEPKVPASQLGKGTYYLQSVDNLERRFYARNYSTSTAAVVATRARTLSPRITSPRMASSIMAPLLKVARRLR